MTICDILRDIKDEAERHNKIVEELLQEIKDGEEEIYYDEFGNKGKID